MTYIDSYRDSNETMGSIIKQWRNKHGWTQKKLGEKVNLSQSAIYMLEKGKYKQTRKIIALAKVMGIPPENLDTYDNNIAHSNKKDMEKLKLIKTILDAAVPDWQKIIPKSALHQ